MFTPITNHTQQALARLLTQYQNSPNIRGLLTGIISNIQDIENELGVMNTARYLPDAMGAQLDTIGDIVGVKRPPGLSDAGYLILIFEQIKINTSEGQPEAVIQAFLLFTGAPTVILYEGGNADILPESIYVPANQAAADQLITSLMEVTPAGVRVDGFVTYDPNNAFAYAGTLPGFGYDDGSQTVGGMYPTLWQFIGNGFEYAGDDPFGLGYGSLKDPLAGGAYIT